MLKAIFTELNQEFGLPITVGEKDMKNLTITEAHKEAKKYVEMLTEVRNTQVSYMLSKNNAIIAYLN